MVTIHSQYRKHFKGPRWDNVAISEYNRKKDYCIGRRSVEHSHQPLEWDTDDSENSDGDLETKPKLRQVGYTNKTSNANRLAETEKAVRKQAWDRVEDVNKNNSANKEMATQTSHRKHSKHRKSKRKREKSAAEEGKGLVSNKERLGKRVPFICYGWANNAPIEKKYTHNVRADSKDVSALHCTIYQLASSDLTTSYLCLILKEPTLLIG